MLTSKQEKFCLEYVICGNITEAAKKAGYSEKTAYSTGSENMKKPEIAEKIQQITEEIKTAKIADATEVMQTLTRVLRREEKENVVVTLKSRTSDFDEHGKKRTVEKEEPNIVPIPTKVSDVNKAAELLGRRYSLFTDRVSVEGEGLVTIVNDLPRGQDNDPVE